MRNGTVALVLAGSALLAGGCGSSSSSSSSSASSSAPSVSSSTTVASSSPSQTASASPGICRAAQLSLSVLGQQGATGHGEIAFALRNTGSATCTTQGYPGILFLSSSGAPLPTTPQHTTHDLAGSLPDAPIHVAPGHSFSFRLFVTHGFNPGARCANAAGIQVIPPNDTATLRLTIPQGLYECITATVSPVQPGSSAYGG